MHTNVLKITILLASPGDLAPERECIDRIVTEFNRNWGSFLGLEYRLIKYETDVIAGMGEDAQAVVNAQVGEAYDVLLAMLWARLGTRTARAESGTVEEYDRACALAKTRVISIMLFFKTQPVPVNVDPDQLAKVQDFRRRVETTALVKEFNDLSALEVLVRFHLDREAQRRLSTADISRRIAGPRDGTELGLLVGPTARFPLPASDPSRSPADLLKFGAIRVGHSTAALLRIVTEVNDLTAAFVRTTQSIRLKADREDVEATFRDLGPLMLHFVQRIRAELGGYFVSYADGVNAYSKALVTSLENPGQHRQIRTNGIDLFDKVLVHLEGLLRAIVGARQIVEALVATLAVHDTLPLRAESSDLAMAFSELEREQAKLISVTTQLLQELKASD